ncbi:MAG: NUDIX domain-containing protein [Candidatus Nanohaloarchaea archaeon]
MDEEDEPLDVVAAVAYSPGDDEFLMVERSPDRKWFPGRWEFPSGVIEDEEPKEAALRELREETGLVGKPGLTGEPHIVESEYGVFRVHPVLVLVDREEVELTDEHSEYRWLGLSGIDELDTVKGLKKDLEALKVGDDG